MSVIHPSCGREMTRQTRGGFWICDPCTVELQECYEYLRYFRIAQLALAEDWDSPEDDVYDKL